MKAEYFIKKYNLKKDTYYNESPYKKRNLEQSNLDSEKEKVLLEKWNDYIIDGFYGFSIGSPVPYNWFDLIDEILETLKISEAKFKICQIKIKYGSIRFYIDNLSEETQKELQKIENELSDKYLIY